MLSGIGSVRLAQILFVIGCLTAHAQDLVKEDDGFGIVTVLYKQPLWPETNFHFNNHSLGWTAIPGYAMQKSSYGGNYSAADGWWEYSLKSSQLEFCFNDNNGIWDTNDHQNYKVNSAGTWALVSKSTEVPAPLPPTHISGAGYAVIGVEETGNKITLQLLANPTSEPEQFGADIKELVVDITKLEDSVRVKITDKNAKRWEVPLDLYSKGGLSKESGSGGQGQQGQGNTKSNLEVTYTKNPFTVKVARKSDGYVLFDSSKLDLVFKDQYLQIGTDVQSDLNVYGLGESTRGSMRLSPGEKHTMWARDQGSFDRNVNTYSSHPFYLGLNGQGKAHGVFLLNSNGMDVTLEDGRLIYQVIGGILDFHIISGPTPSDVVTQYTSLIGRPKMMPYWSYGWHQCRWGYKSVSALREVVDKYAENQLPLDVLWADIDYMNRFYDFTLDPVNYPQEAMTKLLSDVHSKGQKFVPIIDPGIPDDETDIAYKRGLELDVYIKDTTGKPYLGQVWPGPTVFPDFFHPNSTGYWEEQLERMQKMIDYDGIWIDMNELANFCPGTSCKRKEGVQCPNTGSIDVVTSCCLECTGDGNKWDNPPFAINNGNSHDKIFNKAISTSSLQFGNIRQYDSHNLYGFTESIATNAIVEKLRKKRAFVLSRSTFPGSGAHAAHWTGDNAAQWNDLQWSVTTIQNFGLFGIPMIGADICGFSGNSNMELCARWTALGAFYPFARNHNNFWSIPQETYVWPEVAAVGRKFIGMRYRLLPYLYTLGYQAHLSGTPIARPLFMEFPEDANTHAGIAIQRQFMLGSALLVTPVVFHAATSITGYVPAGTWYNLFDYSHLNSTGQDAVWNVKLDDMPVYVRGGSIIPLHQAGAMTSEAARATPFDLLVALPSDGKASGQIYLDDGEDIEGVSKSTVVEFRVESGKFTSKVGLNGYKDAKTKNVSKIVVLGVSSAPKSVTVNQGKPSQDFKYDGEKQVLEIDLKEKFNIAQALTVTWN
ncbi:hypothetical protein Poli38472_005266 [Pythium oligandrum]|uniref:alpha-glucosidase n=1 Tax=Pythium oligandrum TaxID=41045 RepID=A0A8K1CHM7_PYTOL|nr:hypothetical protein Poli38472_005266 [Pythium oligandrum]|eukprot:TMW62648.1 hypothetical protein Poli38472_005266 [Pythium oligandrum]